jgi:hypothetical protein
VRPQKGTHILEHCIVVLTFFLTDILLQQTFRFVRPWDQPIMFSETLGGNRLAYYGAGSDTVQSMASHLEYRWPIDLIHAQGQLRDEDCCIGVSIRLDINANMYLTLSDCSECIREPRWTRYKASSEL